MPSRIALCFSLFLAGVFAAAVNAAPKPGPGDWLPGPPPVLDAPAPSQCTSLIGLGLPGGSVSHAELISGGSFDPFGPHSGPGIDFFPSLSGLPSFCRVAGSVSLEPGSLIKLEVWIPFDGTYRRRYLQVGNGGFSGAVPYSGLAEAIRRGYATAGTDDGNQVFQNPDFAQHLPKLRDFGHRSLKVTRESARIIINQAMGREPARSYFHGCSNGGRQALMQVQRYAEDFDGVIAGAPANNFTHQFISFAWNARLVYQSAPSVSARFSPAHFSTLAKNVRAQCAGKDGGLASDKFLTNPLACKLNFKAFTCKPGTVCLTKDDIGLIQQIYGGPVHDDTKAQIFPGLEPGAEDFAGNWTDWLLPAPGQLFSLQAAYGAGFFSKFVAPAVFDLRNVNYGAQVDSIDSDTGEDSLQALLNSTDPDLSQFYDRGGKLIQYHGFDDAAVAAKNSINYWASVEARMKQVKPGFTRADLDGFYRLFMVPGMGHCGGGPGPHAFGNIERGSAMNADHDVLLALERWVERGVAPTRIIARHPSTGSERPICPYPQLPRFNGSKWSCVAFNPHLPKILLPKFFPRKPIVRLPIPPRPGERVRRQ